MIVQMPAINKAKKAATQGMRSLSQLWSRYGHAAFHYSFIPCIFAYGLYQAGELALDPIVLFNKIIVP